MAHGKQTDKMTFITPLNIEYVCYAWQKAHMTDKQKLYIKKGKACALAFACAE